jgi:hypothetical protein
MYNYDIDEVERLTGFSDNRRKALAKYYLLQPDQIRIESHKLQFDLMQQNNKKMIKGKKNEFTYAYFLTALHYMQNIETKQSRKAALTPEEVRRIEHIRKNRIKAAHRTKPSTTKTNIELEYFYLIQKLRDENLSWRDISRYIAKFHKKRISHVYLAQCFNQISKEKIERGESL